MNYKPNFIAGMTIEQINNEISEIYFQEYAYSRGIDRPRLWDLFYTRDCLSKASI